MNLIRNCEETVVGKKYDFESIKNYTTFAERVPVSTYEELEPMIELTEKVLKMFFGNTNQMVRQIKRYNQCQKQIYSRE
jgi:hypothetical protein